MQLAVSGCGGAAFRPTNFSLAVEARSASSSGTCSDSLVPFVTFAPGSMDAVIASVLPTSYEIPQSNPYARLCSMSSGGECSGRVCVTCQCGQGVGPSCKQCCSCTGGYYYKVRFSCLNIGFSFPEASSNRATQATILMYGPGPADLNQEFDQALTSSFNNFSTPGFGTNVYVSPRSPSYEAAAAQYANSSFFFALQQRSLRLVLQIRSVDNTYIWAPLTTFTISYNYTVVPNLAYAHSPTTPMLGFLLFVLFVFEEL